MKIFSFFIVIIQLIPLNNNFFYPFPSYFHSSLHIISISLLGLSTETFNHCQKLWYEICYSCWIFCHIVLYYVQLFELGWGFQLICHCFGTFVFYFVVTVAIIAVGFAVSKVVTVMRVKSTLLLSPNWVVSPVLFFLVFCYFVLKSDDQMFELGNFLIRLSSINRLRAFPFIKFQLSLALLKSQCKIIMNFSHFGDMNLFIHQSFFKNPILFFLPVQLKNSNNFIFLFLDRIRCTGFKFRRIEGCISNIIRGRIHTLCIGFIIINWLFLRDVGDTRMRSLLNFTIESIFSVIPLYSMWFFWWLS